MIRTEYNYENAGQVLQRPAFNLPIYAEVLQLSPKTLNSLYHASDSYLPQSSMEYLRNKESV